MTGLADPIHGGGVNHSEKGEQSCLKELLADGFGVAGVATPSLTATTATPGAAAMDSIAARVVITLLLIPVFVALIADAIRLDGIAAPILGR